MKLSLAGVFVVAACAAAFNYWRPNVAEPITADAGPPAAGEPADMWFRGMAIQLQSAYRPRETFFPLLREIADLGADTVSLTAAAWMEHARAQAIFIDARKTPPPDDFRAIIREAKRLGLKVIVMPIILIKHPRGSDWRGVINPPDWIEWFDQYREFVGYFADIAAGGGADAMLVGSELVSTEKFTAQWVRTIEQVRKQFSGKLGYSANWDHYKPVQYWDKLDFIGMTSYYKLADRKGASVDEMIAKWRPVHRKITTWRKEIGKPLILTEVGWCSQLGAATAPWNYYQNMKATPEGREEQRRLYEAFIRVWDGTPGLAGVIWWEWSPQPGGDSDYNYTPKNKPAERLLREWFAAGRATRGGDDANTVTAEDP